MDHLLTFLVAVILAFVCVTSLPLREDGDISKLSDLLGKLRTLQKRRQDSQNWKHFKSSVASDGKTELSDLGNPKSELAEEDIMSPSLNDDIAGVVLKRQGAWSYDYGLGGGRFGKRNYADYGIGGGRFGRDVDHVDLGD